MRPRIVPVSVPHGSCPPGCPWCPDEHEEVRGPHPDEVPEAVELALQRHGGDDRPLELAFYGGDVWTLPRDVRTALLDAAEREVRRKRVASIRLTLTPSSVLHAPLNEFLRRGLRAVELPVHSLDRDVMRLLGHRGSPRLAHEAVGRLARARVRSIVHLCPGLPGSSHESAVHSAERIAHARPDAARILPALALEGTRLGAAWQERRWEPMRPAQAVSTCKSVVDALRRGGVEIIRLGLQPRVDLARRRRVLAGPFDPNLRLLVESELLARKAGRALTSSFRLGTRAFTLVVHPAEESFLRGPENRSVRALRDQFRLDRLRVVGHDEQPRGTVRAFAGELGPGEIPPLPPRRGRRAS